MNQETKDLVQKLIDQVDKLIGIATGEDITPLGQITEELKTAMVDIQEQLDTIEIQP